MGMSHEFKKSQINFEIIIIGLSLVNKCYIILFVNYLYVYNNSFRYEFITK